MKLWKKIISLNLALIMIISMLPMTAYAALTLDGLSAISNTESTYTASSDGLYKFYIEATYNGNAASSGDLVLYNNSTVAEYFGYTSTSAYTILAPLTAGQEYVVSHTASDGELDLQLSATKLTTTTLSVGNTINVLTSYPDPDYTSAGYAYVAVDVSTSGWYTLSAPTAYHMQSIPTSIARDEAEREITVYLDAANTPYYFLVASTLNNTVSVNFSSADIQTISENQDATITCSETYVTYFKKFVAQNSGQYTISATNPSDFYKMVLCDAEGDLLAYTYGDEYFYGPICATLTAGETYYIGVSGDYWAESDDISFIITCDSTTGLTLVSSGYDDGILKLTFNDDLANNFNWLDDRAIYVRDYDTNEVVLTIEDTMFYSLPCSISGSTLSIPLDGYVTGGKVYYVTIDDGLIKSDDGNEYAGLSGKAVYFFLPLVTTERIQFDTGMDDTIATVSVEWDDTWFENPSTTYNHELATTAMGLSGAAYNKSAIYNALESLEFENINQVNYNYNHTVDDNDVVAYNFATKTIYDDGKEYTLVAVVIKGTSGDEEWYSNFNLGKNGEFHTGFYTAATDVISDLQSYLASYGLNDSNAKLLVTGHSRGAAVANIVAAYETNTGLLKKENIFGYTFATPTVSTDAKEVGCENIFNIISGEDFVPQMPLSSWGFRQYGVNLYLPSSSYSSNYKTVSSKMETMYKSLTGETFNYYSNGTIAVSNLADDVYNLASTVNNYYSKNYISHWVILPIAWCTPSEYFYSLAETLVGDAVGVSFALTLESLTDYNEITNFFISEEMIKGNVFSAHCMATYFSWLDMCTSDELFGNANSYSYPTYERLTVACPVDVYVYDETGALVASVVNEEIVENTLAVDVTDGVKTIDLPAGQEYSVKVVAREEGSVDYSVAAMSMTGSNVTTERTVLYDDIAVSADDELAGAIPSTLSNTATGYTLLMNTEDTLDPPTVIDGAIETDSAYAYIDVSITGNGTLDPDISDGQSLGIAKGESQTFTFTASSGSYISDVLVDGVSVGAVDSYTFDDVNDDHTLAVTFKTTSSGSSSTSVTYYDIDLSYTGEGSVTPATTKMAKSSSKTFYFTPDEGYQISDVFVNGDSVGAVESYTISSIKADHSIEVVFSEIENEDVVMDVITFTDVDEDAYYYDAVLWAVKNGVTSGTTETTFSPDATCTRAQAVTFLYRAAGEPDITGENPFSDVNADAYYYNAVLWAVEMGITSGTTETTFSPDAVCSRSQIVTFMYRAAGEPVVTGDCDFADVDADAYYYNAVLWAAENGITSGATATTFAPNSDCTRGQIVTFLYRGMAE